MCDDIRIRLFELTVYTRRTKKTGRGIVYIYKKKSMCMGDGRVERRWEMKGVYIPQGTADPDPIHSLYLVLILSQIDIHFIHQQT